MTAMIPGLSAETRLLSRLATPVFLARPDGAVIYANPAALDLLRAGRAGNPGDDRLFLTVPERCLFSLTAGAPDEPTRARAIIRRRHADGGDGPLLTLDVRLSRLYPDGAPPDGCGLLLAEGAMEAAARKEIQRLTEQLVALSFGYNDMRFEVTPDGAVLDFAVANPADINVQPERLLEGTIQQALPSPAGPALRDAVRRLADGGGEDSLSFSLPGPAGEQYFEARLAPLVEGERYLITIRNVTDRVQAQQEAARTRDRLVEALESISDGFVLYDNNDRLVLANSRYRNMFDVDGDTIVPGAHFEDVLRNAAARAMLGVTAENLEGWVRDRLTLHRRGGPPVEAQLTDGRWLRVDERITPSGDRVGLRSDITELKQREAELRAAREAADIANEQKTGFVHHLSHELRTPLNAVLGFAQMIADELLGPAGNPRYPAYARQIAEAGSYMLDLINNLLDLAKIEAGRFPIVEETCDLTMMVGLVMSMMAERAARARVEIVSELPPDTPPLIADSNLVRQMLTNLVSNAVKFCPPKGGGRVTVGARHEPDGGLSLFVRDNGAGMTPEQIPRALSPFQQVHDRRMGPDGGTGLGLPLTRALIELHSGRFVIESAVGQGTTVYLAFPPERVGRLLDGDGI